MVINYFKVVGAEEEHIFFFGEDTVYSAYELASRAADTEGTDVWIYRRVPDIDCPVVGFRDKDLILREIMDTVNPEDRRLLELEYAHVVLSI